MGLENPYKNEKQTQELRQSTAVKRGENPDIVYTENNNLNTGVTFAEQVIRNAFRGWIKKAELGARRTDVILKSPLSGPEHKINEYEGTLIDAIAELAMTDEYGNQTRVQLDAESQILST